MCCVKNVITEKLGRIFVISILKKGVRNMSHSQTFFCLIDSVYVTRYGDRVEDINI